jgi:hypothetical protein
MEDSTSVGWLRHVTVYRPWQQRWSNQCRGVEGKVVGADVGDHVAHRSSAAVGVARSRTVFSEKATLSAVSGCRVTLQVPKTPSALVRRHDRIRGGVR